MGAGWVWADRGGSHETQRGERTERKIGESWRGRVPGLGGGGRGGASRVTSTTGSPSLELRPLYSSAPTVRRVGGGGARRRSGGSGSGSRVVSVGRSYPPRVRRERGGAGRILGKERARRARLELCQAPSLGEGNPARWCGVDARPQLLEVPLEDPPTHSRGPVRPEDLVPLLGGEGGGRAGSARGSRVPSPAPSAFVAPRRSWARSVGRAGSRRRKDGRERGGRER